MFIAALKLIQSRLQLDTKPFRPTCRHYNTLCYFTQRETGTGI